MARFGFSIRLKIMALIGSALTVSLLSYVYVGSSLIEDDKVSYIYDYDLAQVKVGSDAIENEIERTIATGRLLLGLSREGTPLPETAFGGDLLVLRPSAGGERFEVEARFGKRQAELALLVPQLGWTPALFEQKEIMIGNTLEGNDLPIGGRALDAGGKPVAFLALLKLDLRFLEAAGKDFELHLLDSLGKRILTRPAKDAPAIESGEFEKKLLQSSFDTGVQDWGEGKDASIVAYRRLARKNLLLVGYISRDVAFAAARTLTHRSLALGLSILCLAVGMTLIFARGLTRKLRQMWHATQKVSEGDFSVRVEVGRGGNDEVTGLARSFNAMADKIHELMAATAQKARMEKELETAQAVQKLFFPAVDFTSDQFKLAGRSLPASECAGDWWHWISRDDWCLVAVGDVTGHGVSAALVTAAAHGAFTVLMGQLATGSGPPQLERLLSELNSAVLAAGGTRATMTFVASLVNLQTGEMLVANASHCAPYIYRPPSPDAPPIKAFKPLIDSRASALGAEFQFTVEVARYQLEPGDMILWYTDGLVECENPTGKRLTKISFLKNVAKAAIASGGNPRAIGDVILDSSLEYIGGHELADDITVVVGTVPAGAVFTRKAA